MARSGKWLLGGLGFGLIALCLVASRLKDLGVRSNAFEYIFFAAFGLYALAGWIVLQSETIGPGPLWGIFALGIGMLSILVYTKPVLSDDMYRYIWDGRVQAHAISPYRYPPDAPELALLRDPYIYPLINRKAVVTVYPPAAQAAFFLIWRLTPDNIHSFQVVMAAGGLLAGLLLVGLLRDLGRSTGRVLLFLWSPLFFFETAHSAHIEGLVLPLLVGACWARVRGKDGWVGFLLGTAAAVKFYPALLLPFLWRPQHPRGRWTMPLAFCGAIGLFYLPYLLTSGSFVLGYLPKYLQESFNLSPLAYLLNDILGQAGLSLPGGATLLSMGIIAALAVWAVFHPAVNAEAALRRCIWPIGVYTLLSQNLYPWYMLWLLPLVAIFLETSPMRRGVWRLPRLDAWIGWWLFCGLVGLSYFPIAAGVPFALLVYGVLLEFMPLYIFLMLGSFTLPWKKIHLLLGKPGPANH